MATVNFQIVAGNTAPAYVITCERAGKAIDLTGASVVVNIYNKQTRQQTNEADSEALIVTPAAGVISYVAEPTDFPSKGYYYADIEITYDGGGIEILYNQAVFKVRNPGV